MERISPQELPQGMFNQLMATEQFLNQSGLDFSLLELLRLRISQINGCAYCVDMHHKELKHRGETELRLASLCVWRETPYFSEKERLVLDFAEQLTRAEQNLISDQLFELLLHHFDKAALSMLTLSIAQINVWNRLMKVFRFEPGKYEVKQ